MTSHEVDPGLLAAARLFLPGLAGAEPLAGRSTLLRAEHPDGVAVIRRLPGGMTPERAAAEAGLLAALAGTVPAPRPVAAPDGAAVVTVDGVRYSARGWLPGEPAARNAVAYPGPEDWLDLPAILPEGAFAAALAALGRLHVATAAGEALALPPLAPAPLEGLAEAVRAAWSAARDRLRPVIHQTPAAQRWLAASERAMPAAAAALAAAGPGALAPSCVVQLNAWPGHFLFGDGTLSGMLGWDRAAWGSPLLDVAQAAVRLRGWNAATAEETIAAYGVERVLGPDERRALPALAALDLVAITGGLLAAAFAPSPQAPAPPMALRVAIPRMIESLENATAALSAATSPRGSGRPSGAQRRRKAVQGPRTRSRR